MLGSLMLAVQKTMIGLKEESAKLPVLTGGELVFLERPVNVDVQLMLVDILCLAPEYLL